MLDQPGPIRRGEEFDVARLEEYLLANLPDSHKPLTVEQFPSGYSNLTYALRLGQRELVLRRPPFGNLVKSAHDMGREYRVLSRLCEVYEPAPRPYLYCDDDTIIGDEFYVMQRRHGVVLRGPKAPPELASNPALTGQLCEAFIDNLARLHTLDYQAAGLGELGKPEGYIERQVTGWTKRYTRARTDDLNDVEALAAWLAGNRPVERQPALIHNDYKYDNIMLDPDNLTHIVALLDWEMATVGDPLMDLGTTLAYWIEPTDSEPQRARAFGPTMAIGSFNRRELVSRYAEKTGFEIPNPLFYYCFGLFKLAVIVQQIYARYVRGHTQDARFAELNETVASLGRTGVAAINEGSV